MLTQAVVCYPTKDDKVLLGIRKSSSTDLGLNLIAGFGGKVGDHEEFAKESIEDALIRELKEELNITLTSYTHRGSVTFLFPNKPKWSMQTQIYVTSEWEGEPTETESMKPEWFEMRNLPSSQMWEDNQYWVPLVLRGKNIEAIFVYNDDNKTLKDKRVNILV